MQRLGGWGGGGVGEAKRLREGARRTLSPRHVLVTCLTHRDEEMYKDGRRGRGRGSKTFKERGGSELFVFTNWLIGAFD